LDQIAGSTLRNISARTTVPFGTAVHDPAEADFAALDGRTGDGRRKSFFKKPPAV
jgi:hypothetical protein